MDVYGYATVTVTDSAEVGLVVTTDEPLSTAGARALAAALVKAADAAEATYAAQVKRARLEAQILKLQADLEAKVSALQTL